MATSAVHEINYSDTQLPFKCSACPSLFRTTKGKHLHEIRIHKISQMKSPKLLPHKCTICEATFQSHKGKQIHECRLHPSEFHAARSGMSMSKTRWTEEELCLMAATERELTQRGVKHINIEISKKFSHRSVNSIRSQRRLDQYLTHLNKTQDPSSPPLPDQSNAPTNIQNREIDMNRSVLDVDNKNSWINLINAEINIKNKHRINYKLKNQFPHVDVETIKKIRNKPQYRCLLVNEHLPKIKPPHTTSNRSTTSENINPSISWSAINCIPFYLFITFMTLINFHF